MITHKVPIAKDATNPTVPHTKFGSGVKQSLSLFAPSIGVRRPFEQGEHAETPPVDEKVFFGQRLQESTPCVPA